MFLIHFELSLITLLYITLHEVMVNSILHGIKWIIIYLFSVNTFTPIERCAIIFVIAQVGKLLIGQKIQKLQNHARCNRSLIGQ